MEHGIVMTGKGRKNNFMWPSIARLADGRLIAVCSGFRQIVERAIRSVRYSAGRPRRGRYAVERRVYPDDLQQYEILSEKMRKGLGVRR